MDKITELVREQYTKYPYPSLSIGTMEDEILYTTNYEFVSYLCTGSYKLHDDIKILDAGCGTGYSTLKLAQQNPNAKIFAVDISPKSLKIAKNRLETAGLFSERITFIEADLMSLNLDEEFDYIVSTGVLHHLSSPEIGLKNLKEHLKPDGIIYLMLYSKYGRFWLNLTKNFINLLQDDTSSFEEGIKIGKEILRILPEDNQILNDYKKMYKKSSNIINEDFANSDEQFVDAYLNVQEATYNIDELFQFLKSQELNFIQFMDEVTWELEHLLKKNDFLLNKTQKLSKIEKYKIGELIYPEKNFAFFVSKKQFQKKFVSENDFFEKAKIILHKLNKEEKIQEKNGKYSIQLIAPIGLTIQLTQEASKIYENIKNNMSLNEIVLDFARRYYLSEIDSKKYVYNVCRLLEKAKIVFFVL